jgi:hypothetical protein
MYVDAGKDALARETAMEPIERVTADQEAGCFINFYEDGRIELEIAHVELGEGGKCLSHWLPDPMCTVLLTMRANPETGDQAVIKALVPFFNAMAAFNLAMYQVYTDMNGANPELMRQRLAMIERTLRRIAHS